MDTTTFRDELSNGARVGDPASSGLFQVPFRDLTVDTAATVDDLVFSGRYLPAGQGPGPIAGDFYDVVRLGPDLIALLVGDVSGHGAVAVHRMRQLRAAARAYAIDDAGPANLLARLDRFVDRLETDHIATLWYGEYQPSTGTLVYCSAGHLPPILCLLGQTAQPLALASAPPLGTGVAGQHAREIRVVLPPGAVLVAYSDGLVERHMKHIDDQIALLAALVTAACGQSGERTSDAIAGELLNAFVPEPDRAEDDICLLVVRRRP